MNTSPPIVRITLHESGQLKAFADVTFPTTMGEITIRGYRIMQNPRAELWIGKPQSSYSSQGTTKYKNIVDYAQGTERQVRDAILAAYQDQLSEA